MRLTIVCSVFAISSRCWPRTMRLSASVMTVLRYFSRSSSYPIRSHRALRWYLKSPTDSLEHGKWASLILDSEKNNNKK